MNENDKTLKYLIYGTIIFVFGLALFLGISLYSQHKEKQPKVVMSQQEKQNKELEVLKNKHFYNEIKTGVLTATIYTLVFIFVILFLVSAFCDYDILFWILFFVPFLFCIILSIYAIEPRRTYDVSSVCIITFFTSLIGCPLLWWIKSSMRQRRMKIAYQKWFDTLPNLVNCPDCNNKVSKNAKTCPHCGSVLIEEMWSGYSIGIWF